MTLNHLIEHDSKLLHKLGSCYCAIASRVKIRDEAVHLGVSELDVGRRCLLLPHCNDVFPRDEALPARVHPVKLLSRHVHSLCSFPLHVLLSRHFIIN